MPDGNAGEAFFTTMGRERSTDCVSFSADVLMTNEQDFGIGKEGVFMCCALSCALGMDLRAGGGGDTNGMRRQAEVQANTNAPR